MSAVTEPVAKRIANLFRLLSSQFDGEVLGAVAAMRRLFQAEKLTFHDIASVIESCNGEIDEKKFSEADAQVIFERAFAMGRAEEAVKQQRFAPADYYDADRQPRWDAIARFCQRKSERLRPSEQKFVDDMAGNTLWRTPTEKQARWLMTIFLRLGGRRAA
jgi:hypothetical protein